MDRFKSKLSGFGTITKSGEASGAASGSHDGDEKKEETFGTKFGNVTRRLGQQMRNTLGGNECVTDDSEYEERKRRIAELRKHYADMEKKFCKYLDAIRSLCFASSQVGDIVGNHYNDNDCPEQLRKSADTLKDNMKSLDDEIRRLFDEQYVAKVLDPLQAINRHLEEQKKQMSHREYLKLDYDSYVREVAKLKEKGSSQPHKLQEKEAAMEKAKQVLDDATYKLYQDFDLVESKRFSVIAPQINKFLELQRQLFGSGAEAVNQVPNFPKDCKPVDVRPASETRQAHEEQQKAKASQPAVPEAPDRGAQGQHSDKPSSVYTPAPSIETVKVKHPYKPKNADELELLVGEKLYVTKKHDDGWYEGQDEREKKGVFPGNFVEHED